MHSLAWVETGLLAIACERAHECCFTPCAWQSQDQTVEAVAFGFASPDGGERVLEFLAGAFEINRFAVSGAAFDVVNIDALGGVETPGFELQFVVHFGIDEETHVLKDRHRRRERENIAARVELAAHDIVGVARVAIGARADDIMG